MTSIRRQIFEAIIDKLTADVTILEEIFLGTARPNLTKTHAAIVPVQDDFQRSSKLTERSSLAFAVRVVVPEMHQQALLEYEDMAPLIKNAMKADKTWGGLAYDTLLQNEKWLYADAIHPDVGVDLNYIVEYQPADANFS